MLKVRTMAQLPDQANKGWLLFYRLLWLRPRSTAASSGGEENYLFFNDTRHLTPATCQLTCDTQGLVNIVFFLGDTWHLTLNTWHLKCDTWHIGDVFRISLATLGQVKIIWDIICLVKLVYSNWRNFNHLYWWGIVLSSTVMTNSHKNMNNLRHIC